MWWGLNSRHILNMKTRYDLQHVLPNRRVIFLLVSSINYISKRSKWVALKSSDTCPHVLRSSFGGHDVQPHSSPPHSPRILSFDFVLDNTSRQRSCLAFHNSPLPSNPLLLPVHEKSFIWETLIDPLCPCRTKDIRLMKVVPSSITKNLRCSTLSQTPSIRRLSVK